MNSEPLPNAGRNDASSSEVRRARVLLIDDDPDDRELCVRMFQRQNFAGDIVCTSSYEEVTQQLQQNPVDIIVCDYSLNGWSGLDVLGLVRETGRDTPFVLLTGYLDDEKAAECMRRGMANCVFKDRLFQLPEIVTRLFHDKLAREEYRRSQAALRASEARARAMLESALDAIVMADASGIILEFNPAAERIFGYSRSEVVGKPLVEIIVPPTTRPAHRAGWERFLREGSSEMLDRRMEMRSVRRDGSEFDAELTITLIRHEGESIVVGFVRDITERRRMEKECEAAERRFRSLVEQSLVGIYVLQGGKFTYVNPKMAEIFRAAPDQILGRSVLEFTAPEHRQIVEEKLRERLSGATASTHYRLRALCADGQAIDAEVHGTVAEYNGQPAIIGTMLDVTRQKQLETQFLQAQKMETVGRLASGIAHDFNNLLTAIGSFAQLAHDDAPEGGTMRSDLEQVLSATTRAASLTSKLLAFARQQMVQPTVLSPASVLKEMEKILSRLVRENIEFQISAPADVGSLKADPTQFEQVIINLVVNAIDAMPQGGRLIVSTRNVDLAAPTETRGGTVPVGQYVALQIEDTGKGMSEETLEHLFEPFFTTKPPGQGTGLGLAMVYGMVTQASGHIVVSSTPGAGTKFEILFPRVAPNAKERAIAGSQSSLRGTASILLVEDQEDVRRAVSRMLRAYGYSVEVASDAEEALGLLKQNDKIQVLITDVVLPGMDGKRFATAAVSERPGLKVLIVSGYNEVVTNADLEKGSFAYLSKPFSGQALALKINELLGGPVSSK